MFGGKAILPKFGGDSSGASYTFGDGFTVSEGKVRLSGTLENDNISINGGFSYGFEILDMGPIQLSADYDIGAGQIVLETYDSNGSSQILIEGGSNDNITVTTENGSMKYFEDYSQYFNDRSLIDRGYLYKFISHGSGNIDTNFAIGNGLSSNTIGERIIAIGDNCLNKNISGVGIVGIGYNVLTENIDGIANCAVGNFAMESNRTGSCNNGFGYEALYDNIDGNNNSGLGNGVLYNNYSGSYNSAIGDYALARRVDGTYNRDYDNCTGLGNSTRVSASNQVQLGNSSTTTYAFGAVQDRSDKRDKEDVRDTVLGLNFINSLRPVDFRWDMRDDYVSFFKNGKPKKIKKDGSKKRNRYHHGFIAQEVEKIIKDSGIDFGGYQDHSKTGGCDIKTIGYNELFAPIVKAVQELSTEIKNIKTSIK